MNAADIILILIIAAVVFLAVRKVIKDRKNGKSCSCGCSGCSADCPVKRNSSSDIS